MTADTGFIALNVVQPRRPDADGPADEFLVRQLCGGDAVAGEVLSRRYRQSLMRYLQRLTGSDQLAEELYQTTWLSVLEHLDKFDPSSNSGGFKAWLFRIATNKTNDVWRSHKREKVAKDGLKRIVEDEAPDSSHQIEGSEQRDKLLWAIQQLPEGQRQVLMLRYYSSMKFVDIAVMLGCPLNTALGRMHKAVQKLKELMTE